MPSNRDWFFKTLEETTAFGRTVVHTGPWETRGPVSITIHCQCGWRSTQTRRQNALGRKSKLEGAFNQHMRDTAARIESKKT